MKLETIDKIMWGLMALSVVGVIGLGVAIYQVASHPEDLAKDIGRFGRAVSDGYGGK